MDQGYTVVADGARFALHDLAGNEITVTVKFNFQIPADDMVTLASDLRDAMTPVFERVRPV
jgi:hypothetical protein